MSSREQILSAVRANRPAAAALPDVAPPWVTYDDPRAQFVALVESVGGRVESVATLADVAAHLGGVETFRAARKTVCRVPGLDLGNCDLDQVDDPHTLEDLDYAILPGQFAIAENGAVWVDDRGLKQRVVYFLCQHLVLVVPAGQLLHNLHQGYDRLGFTEPGFGVFISGPSKTADIEQSLVIGAHGPRSLTVYLVDAG